MRLLLITPSLSSNSLGRTYCLYLLAASLGWESETWSIAGDRVWGPLAGDAFAETCFRAPSDEAEAIETLTARAKQVDLILAVKPVPESLGLAWRIHRATGVPMISDIDDPDIEVLLAAGQPLKALGKRLLRPGVVRTAKRMSSTAALVPRIVSNPELQRLHGGTVIPHVRDVLPARSPSRGGGGFHVAFVGSVQPHKGIQVLRRAIDALASEGYSLTVTAAAPEDRRPHERWIGQTTLEEGLELVASADAIVIPSLPTPWSRGQLPVKLVDAMMLGVCVIVSDIAPLPWAVGDAGVIVQPGRVSSLVDALRALRDPAERARRSVLLADLAHSRYTVGVNRRIFEQVCVDALRH